MDSQQIQKLQSKIGSSFLRGYFPTEHRSLQNQQRILRDTTVKENSLIRAGSTFTGRISQKLYRSLTLISQEIDELLDALNNVNNAVSYGDFILGNMNAAEEAMGGLGDFFNFRRRSRAAREQSKRLKQDARNAEREAKRAEEQNKKTEEQNKKTEEQNKKESEKKKSERAKTQARDEKGRFKKLDKPDSPKESFKLEEPKPTSGSKITSSALKGVGVLFMAKALWDGWSEITALDPTMPRDKYKSEVAKVILKIVADVGLAWVGAFAAAAVVGTFTGGIGAIPAFLVGLVGGAVAQVTLGDSVGEIVDGIVDYMWQGTDEQEAVTQDLSQSMLQPSPTPSTPPAPTPTAQPAAASSVQTPELQPAAAAAGSGTAAAAVSPPSAPTPPPNQEVASTVGSPGQVAAPDITPYTPTSDTSNLEMLQREAEKNAANVINNSRTQQASGGGQQNVLEQESSAYVAPPRDDNTKATISMGGSGLDTTSYGGGEEPGLGSIRTSTGKGAQVHEQLVPNFQGFVNALEATGYKIQSIGGANKRNIAGKNVKSWHSWGAAIDINPGQNPHLKDGRLITDMPPEVGAIASQFGLGWGGNWSSSKDAMHFSAAMNEGGSFNIDRTTGQIVPLAEGGKVTGPTLALIGEAGEPEYVVPQSKVEDFAHEMMAPPTVTKTKKHTHTVVMPIYM